MTQLNGRVFSRLQQYDALPTDLKHEAERLEEYLTTVQGDLFESHRTLTLKSVYGVRVRQLLEKIDAWLKQHGHGMPTTGHTSTAKEIKKHVPGTKEHEDHKRNVESCVPATGHSTSLGDHHTTKSHGPGTKERAKSVDEHHSVKEHIPGTKEHARKSEDYHPVKEHVPGTREHAMATDEYRPVKEHIPGTKERAMAKDEHQMKEQIPGTTEHARAKDRHTAKEHTAPSSNVGNYQTAATGTPATAPVHVITGSSSHSARAKKLLLALVLKGFVTPHKEEKPDEVISKTEDFDFKDTELLAVVSKRITGPHNTTTTVWDLVDGAVFAGMLKRKAGLLEPLTHGKNEYAIVNSRLQTLTLFTSDLGREPKLEMPTNTLKVSFDNSHYENGVKVWSNNDVELLNAADQRESDALVQALLSVGATHDKLNTAPTKTVPEKVKEATGKGAHGHETGMAGMHGHGTGMVDTHGHGSNQVHHDPHGTGVGADAAVGAGHTNDPSRGFNNQPNPHHLVKSDEQRRYDAQHMTNDLNEKNPTLDHAKDHTTEPTSGFTNQTTPSHDTYGMGDGAYDKTNPTYGQGTTGSGAMKNQQQGWQDDKLNQTYGRNASPTHHAYAP